MSATARMQTERRGAGSRADRAPLSDRCIVSARYTDHEGPVYGVVEGLVDGIAMVTYVDEATQDQVAEIPESRLTHGAVVERQMLNGRPAELLYRCYLVPVQSEDVSVWRLCQVERVSEDINEPGGHLVHYRPKGYEDGMLSSTVTDFRSSVLKVSKEDYLLDVGDWTQSDVPVEDLQDGMDETDRGEIRAHHPRNVRVRMVGRIGLMEHTTWEAYLRRHNVSSEGYVAGTSALRPMASPRPNLTNEQAIEPALREVSVASAGGMFGSGTFSYSPISTGVITTPLASAVVPATTPYCKYDYNPRRNQRHRATLIFSGGDYQLIGTSPGDQLESLRSQEIIPSPGSGIDLFHCTWGFNWGELPLGISNIKFVGGGQSRKIEEPNVNKAITAAMKRRNLTLTTMAELGHSTLQMAATARRWYRHEIVDIMVILDEYARMAQMTEGSNASKSIVGAYVSLIEIALRVVGTALNGMATDTFKDGISAAKVQVLRTIALSSETFQLTVGIARTAEYHSRMPARGGGANNNNHQGEPKRPRVGGDRLDGNKVPANVVAALKNKDGKALCLGFLNNKCTRKAGTCRFIHEPTPEGLAQEVLDWISSQDAKKN